MKKEKDIGLQYVMELGFRPAKTVSQFYSIIRDRFGKDVASDIELIINNRYDAMERGERGDDTTFYKLKNRNIDLSVAISGAFDGDIIRQVCNYISSQSVLFRDCTRILEVGCDCGIISCFLGRTFPEAQIVSIDRCEESIVVAKELATRLGVTNVTFQYADVQDFPDDEYDAIFSIRVMHENFLLGEKEDHTLFMETQGEKFAEETNGYAEILSSKLSNNGLLLSIERCGRNPLLYGWMLALNEHGFIIQNYNQICCQEIGEESHFQALNMKKSGSKLSRDEVWNQFTTCFFGGNKELMKVDFSDWEASVVLQELHGKLIDGVFIYVDGEKVGKVAIWESKDCETDILIEQYIKGQMQNLSIRDIKMRDKILQQISNDKEYMKKEWGATFVPFEVIDGKEVELK